MRLVRKRRAARTLAVSQKTPRGDDPSTMTRHSSRRYHSPVIHTVTAHADHLLISEASTRGLAHLTSTRWETPNRIDALPGRRLFEITYRQTDVHELVCEVEPGLVYIRQLQNTVIATIAAPTRASADDVLTEVRAALPDLVPEEDAVPALFWWMRDRKSVV